MRPGTRTTSLTTLVLACALASAALAGLELREADPADPSANRDISQTIWFQGFVADPSTGDPVDATYDVIAEMFDSDVDGSSVWGPETHAATPIVGGWFNIELGVTVDLPTFPTPPYYLELTINGETLAPRQKLGSVPSAFRSARSDDADDDWIIQGPSIYRMGYTGIGMTVPERDLDVAGTVRMDAFEMVPGAAAGHVLTSDASGAGTWQAPTGGGEDSDWVFDGDDLHANTDGSVAIGIDTGITSPEAKLHVRDSDVSPDPTAIKGFARWETGVATGVHGVSVGSTSMGVRAQATADTGTTSYGVHAHAHAPGAGSATGLYGDASVGEGGGATGLYASASAYGTGSSAHGVYAYAYDPNGDAFGVYGLSNDTGVRGENTNSGTSGALATYDAGVYGAPGFGGTGWAGYFGGRVYVSDRLGVGVSTPTHDLQVWRDRPGDLVELRLTNASSDDSSGATLTFEDSSGETSEITMHGENFVQAPRTTIYDNRTSAYMSLGLRTAEYIRLQNDRVGIGGWGTHFQPSAKLHVKGAGSAYGGVAGWQEVVAAFEEEGGYHTAISINSGLDEDAILYFAENGNAYWSLRHDSSDAHKLSLRYSDGGVSWITPVTVDSMGFVGIGTSTPAFELDVAGDIQCVELHQTSDARLKTDVRPLERPLERIEAIPAVSFVWREEAGAAGATPGERSIGVLAQDVESVLPEAVTSGDGTHKSVNYAELTALLIGAVQELSERNEALEARISELEGAN